jgi:hypothetical protein
VVGVSLGCPAAESKHPVGLENFGEFDRTMISAFETLTTGLTAGSKKMDL